MSAVQEDLYDAYTDSMPESSLMIGSATIKFSGGKAERIDADTAERLRQSRDDVTVVKHGAPRHSGQPGGVISSGPGGPTITGAGGELLADNGQVTAAGVEVLSNVAAGGAAENASAHEAKRSLIIDFLTWTKVVATGDDEVDVDDEQLEQIADAFLTGGEPPELGDLPVASAAVPAAPEPQSDGEPGDGAPNDDEPQKGSTGLTGTATDEDLDPKVQAARDELRRTGQAVPPTVIPPEGFELTTAGGERRCLAKKADDTQCQNAEKVPESHACHMPKHQEQVAAITVPGEPGAGQ